MNNRSEEANNDNVIEREIALESEIEELESRMAPLLITSAQLSGSNENPTESVSF